LQFELHFAHSPSFNKNPEGHPSEQVLSMGLRTFGFVHLTHSKVSSQFSQLGSLQATHFPSTKVCLAAHLELQIPSIGSNPCLQAVQLDASSHFVHSLGHFPHLFVAST